MNSFGLFSPSNFQYLETKSLNKRDSLLLKSKARISRSTVLWSILTVVYFLALTVSKSEQVRRGNWAIYDGPIREESWWIFFIIALLVLSNFIFIDYNNEFRKDLRLNKKFILDYKIIKKERFEPFGIFYLIYDKGFGESDKIEVDEPLFLIVNEGDYYVEEIAAISKIVLRGFIKKENSIIETTEIQ